MQHRLPVSGIDVAIHLPTGAEDVLLVEAGPPGLGVAIALLDRLVARLDGGAIDWFALTPTDIDVMLLLVRRRVIGDAVIASARCGAPSCGARVDISFSIAAYLAHHEPSDHALAPARDGWFQLDGAVEFRLPSAADQLAIALDPDPEGALLQRCVRSAASSNQIRGRVEAAMESIAPSLFTDLEGPCPECGTTVHASFDPVQFALRELRDQARLVFEETLAIARETHWSEADILSLPTARRARYAELIGERA